ncbi:MAG: hypothetical protein E7566_06165 [Ruminococcaceae bacterium]|nr:hypothetical protein [Oscillospiraceae bacterium]
MPKLKIADVVVEMPLKYPQTAHWYSSYLVSDEEAADIKIETSQKEMDYLVKNGIDITEPIAENMVLCNKFNSQLIRFFGSYIHSSALKYEDKVYLFSADSGVGKSTHTKKWCRLFPDKARVINDDKPSFRMIDGKCIVYGSPFSGGTNIQINEKGELGAIVFIERSEENKLERLDTRQAIVLLIRQTHKRVSEKARDRLLSMMSEILLNYPVYKLYCADNDEAVETAFKIIN